MHRNRDAAPFILSALAALLAPVAGHAKEWHELVRFQEPVRVEIATESTANEPDRQVTCTIYPDAAVRQRDTDTPDPDVAMLIPLASGAAFACRQAPGPGARKLEVSGMNLLGRTGPLLVFEAADTNGVIPFSVFEAGTGRMLLTDTVGYEGIDSAETENGGLKLGFKRAVRVDCSIPQQGAACWKRLVREEKVPAPVAALPAPTRPCADAYRAAKAPKDAESIVSFPVRLSWAGAGPLEIQASGPLRCHPTS